MYKLDYAAIIEYKGNDENLLKQVDILSKQKYPPNNYYIVSTYHLDSITVDKLYKKFAEIDRAGKWSAKIAGHLIDPQIEKCTNADLIDEFFVTKRIQNVYSLYLNQDIDIDFSERLLEHMLKFKGGWYYKVENNIMFGTKLCEYYTFDKLEQGIIADGYKNRIFYDQPQIEHTST